MNCIVGLITDIGILLGRDSYRQTTTGSRVEYHDNGVSKLVSIGNDSGVKLAITGCGPNRGLQLILHELDWNHLLTQKFPNLPELISKKTRELLIENNLVDSNGMSPCAFILVHENRLYLLDHDFSVEQPKSFIAVGAGDKYALGVLYSTHDTNMDGMKRIELALTAAAYFDTCVCQPFHVLPVSNIPITRTVH